MVSATEVKVGQILKLHGIYCAVVLDKFTSESGQVVLRVQTLRNVFRGFGPEIIDTARITGGLYPATLVDINEEIKTHDEVVAAMLAEMMSAIKEG